MKAERRHQLQENSLDHMLAAAPLLLRKYGTQILLGLLVVILAVVMIRKRAEGARETAEQTHIALTDARYTIEQIPRTVTTTTVANPKPAFDLLATSRDKVEQQLSFIFEHGEDPSMLAEARLARGDLNWELANYPEFPEAAATRPSLKLDKSDDQFLDLAAAEYQNVAKDEKASPLARTTARFSLAAVAENRRKWDDAKSSYQSIIDDAKAPEPFKAQARQRVAALDLLKVEQILTQVAPPSAASLFAPLPSTQPTTQSATAPAATQAATAPATKPATLPPFSLPGLDLPGTPPVEKK